MSRFWSITAVVAVATALLVPLQLELSAPPAAAANASDFKPGNIISDANFFDGDAMSESEIQAFLNSQGGTCQSGYTCLKDYKQTTYTRSADPMCGSYAGGSNESSARIIAKVAIACNISPRVLLVTLQKEQSLVTTTSPSASRYGAAMGFACPDTAPCDTEYYGFYNQVYKSAWQFKRYANPPGTSNFFSWYPVGKVSNVLYSPDASCGSSPVLIENQATAGLYYYTPYQPNASALANLYGSGDSCGAYGNRNFWRLYSDWFGSPTGSIPGSVDAVSGGYNGITVSGWAFDPNSTQTAYIWINVDGQGQAYSANASRSWFDAMFPGYGPNHGFDVTIKRPPGTYEVCVHNSTANVLISCRSVVVPLGAGSLDSVAQLPGGFIAKGWAVDYRSTSATPVRLTVNGQPETTVSANLSTPWIDSYFPGIGTSHGFEARIKRPAGSYEVCAQSVGITFGCSTIVVQKEEAGSLDALTATPGSIRLTGWAFDRSTKASSYVWVDVDGKGGAAYSASLPLGWFEGYFPEAGKNHGFDITLTQQTAGPHRVCVYGSGTGVLIGCKSVTVPAKTKVENGAFTATAAPGSLRIDGWAFDTSTTDPSYVWVDIDGQGTAYKAANTISWFEGIFPGAGKNHGFDITLPQTTGPHTVCVYGAASSKSFGCQTVNVPAPPKVENGAFTATAAPGSIRIDGWAFDTSTTDPSYVWVDIDGQGTAYKAANTISWFEGIFPGAGKNHGFDITLPQTTGPHTVCVYGAASSKSFGCQTVNVP